MDRKDAQDCHAHPSQASTQQIIETNSGCKRTSAERGKYPPWRHWLLLFTESWMHIWRVLLSAWCAIASKRPALCRALNDLSILETLASSFKRKDNMTTHTFMNAYMVCSFVWLMCTRVQASGLMPCARWNPKPRQYAQAFQRSSKPMPLWRKKER